MVNFRSDQWDESYKRRENFLFYPNESVIRFTSKYIQKRSEIDPKLAPFNDLSEKKIIDLGCGIGRHTVYFLELGLEAYGVDLSKEAINYSISWARQKNLNINDKTFTISTLTELNFEDNYFDFAVSSAVLDSMDSRLAKLSIEEINRVLKPGAFFYCDLIAGRIQTLEVESSGEEIVKTDHEYGTIQSYFDLNKIHYLIEPYFEILDINLVTNHDIKKDERNGRYYTVFRKLI